MAGRGGVSRHDGAEWSMIVETGPEFVGGADSAVEMVDGTWYVLIGGLVVRAMPEDQGTFPGTSGMGLDRIRAIGDTVFGLMAPSLEGSGRLWAHTHRPDLPLYGTQ